MLFLDRIRRGRSTGNLSSMHNNQLQKFAIILKDLQVAYHVNVFDFGQSL